MKEKHYATLQLRNTKRALKHVIKEKVHLVGS